MGSDSKAHLKRRTLLKSLGATSGVTLLAGCGGGGGNGGGGGGDGDGGSGSGGGDGGSGGDGGGNGGGGDGSGNAGERVPTVDFHFLDFGVYESIAPIIESNIGAIGFEVETRGGETSAVIGDAINDARAFDMFLLGWTPSPDRLDPGPLLGQFRADWAGANSSFNPSQYANCNYHDLVMEQAQASTGEARRTSVEAAQEQFSSDLPVISLMTYFDAGAARSDLVDLQQVGGKAFSSYNQQVQIYSSPTEGDELTYGVDPFVVSRISFFNPDPLTGWWMSIPSSTLFTRNEEWQLEPLLASGFEIENEGRRLVIGLRDGTFTNGDPITSADVQFSLNYMEQNSDQFAYIGEEGYSAIETPDDSTVVIEFEEPNIAWVERVGALWPIIHQGAFEEVGAADNPDNIGNFDADTFVGSGVFDLVTFVPGQQASFEGHDGHPVYPNPGHRLNYVAYQGTQAKINALTNGEIHMTTRLDPGSIRRLESDLGEDQLTTAVADPFTNRFLSPQMSYGPSKFREFRHAIGMAMNRREMVQVGFDGLVETSMHCSLYALTHPWAVDESRLTRFTDNPEGDPEGAAALLTEAGWVQQGGNWFYPADADLSPVWPEGETPSPDDFPCIG